MAGAYRATVLVWTSESVYPTTEASFPFELSDRDLEELEAQRQEQRLGKKIATIELHREQFRRWNAKPMSEQDIRDLLREIP